METLKSASELRIEMKVSDSYFLRVAEEINRYKNTGRVVDLCGSHICNSAELQYAVDKLKGLGYTVSFGQNSHGVKTIIIIW